MFVHVEKQHTVMKRKAVCPARGGGCQAPELNGGHTRSVAGTNIDRLTHRKEDGGCWVEGRGRWGPMAGHALTEGVQLGTSQWLTLGVLF